MKSRSRHNPSPQGNRGTGNTATRFMAALCTTLLCSAPVTFAQDLPRIDGHPDMNGIWQVMNSANWDLEAHSAENFPEYWDLGALFVKPAGQSVVVEGSIPYLPAALEHREELRAGWPESDPETSCYLPGIPRATYLPYPFQILQGNADIMMVYAWHATNRTIHMSNHSEPPVDTWMGRSNGSWEGDTLVVETTGFNARAQLDRAGNHFSSSLKVTERFTLETPALIRYEATLEDPATYSSPWTIRMPLYRHMEENAQLLEHKCVPFVEELIYKDLELPEDN